MSRSVVAEMSSWLSSIYCRKYLFHAWSGPQTSSETQGQIVGARESLNGRKNMARRKVKIGDKSPWEQGLTRRVPNGRRRSDIWLVPENFCVFLPNQRAERRRPFGTGLVRHCPQGLFSPFFTFLRAIFFRPFRRSLAPTICPWVSEDGPQIIVLWRYFWYFEVLMSDYQRFLNQSRMCLCLYNRFTTCCQRWLNLIKSGVWGRCH